MVLCCVTGGSGDAMFTPLGMDSGDDEATIDKEERDMEKVRRLPAGGHY